MTKRPIKSCRIIYKNNLQPHHKARLHFQLGWHQQNDIFTTVTESNVKVLLEKGYVRHVYIGKTPKYTVFTFSD